MVSDYTPFTVSRLYVVGQPVPTTLVVAHTQWRPVRSHRVVQATDSHSVASHALSPGRTGDGLLDVHESEWVRGRTSSESVGPPFRDPVRSLSSKSTYKEKSKGEFRKYYTIPSGLTSPH